MQPRAYSVFHLNLAFSSIAEEARSAVIERCYHPLLDLVESAGLPWGIELTGWTLQQVEQIDPGWVERLRGLVDSGQCELIGSGWTQLIGPLVRYAVNVWNQRLGME
ncbi:MAG: glycoside hydrolase family 57, partial [Gammaproteobacteria bacterium]